MAAPSPLIDWRDRLLAALPAPSGPLASVQERGRLALQTVAPPDGRQEAWRFTDLARLAELPPQLAISSDPLDGVELPAGLSRLTPLEVQQALGHKLAGLILGFGVVAPRSGDQGTDERGEKLFAPFACIVNELEEPEIDRQLLLGNAPMGS